MLYIHLRHTYIPVPPHTYVALLHSLVDSYFREAHLDSFGARSFAPPDLALTFQFLYSFVNGPRKGVQIVLRQFNSCEPAGRSHVRREPDNGEDPRLDEVCEEAARGGMERCQFDGVEPWIWEWGLPVGKVLEELIH